MKVPVEQLRVKLVNHAMTRLIPQMKSGNDRFKVGFAIGMKSNEIVPMLEGAGIVESGEVDVDKVDAAMKTGFAATPDGVYRFRHDSLEDDLVFSLRDWEEFKAQLGA
jgi:hypothetical protein